MMLREARLVRVPAYLQRPKAWWRADPVGRRRAVTRRKSSRTIYPHMCHRSRKTIKGNAKVRERCPSDCPASHVPSAELFTSALPDPGQEVLHPDESEPNVPDVVTSALPDSGQEILHPDESEPNAVGEAKLYWESTASDRAKLCLRGVRDSADAFGPLKSVAGGLCRILDNCEVWSPTDVHHLQRL